MKHSISTSMAVAIVVTMQALCACYASAQDSSDRDRDRENRDHERRLRDDARTEQWRKKFNAAEYLKSQDDNKDGMLSPEEMDGRRTKRFLESMGIPTGRTSKIEDLVKGYNSRLANEAQKKRKEFESRLNNLNQFGAAQETFGVAEFGTEDKPEGVRSFEETASGLKASDFDPEMLQKADKILETFDRDENGFLDGDEISRLTWKSPPPETSDLNRDGRLSKMELAKRFTLAEQTSQKSGSSRARDNSAARGLRSSSKVTSNSDSRSRRSKYDSVAPSDQNRGRRDRERDTRRFEKRDTPQPASSAVAKAKANARSAQGYAKYVDRSFKKYDTNSDGRLDKKELAASSLLKKAKDTDGDGFISKQEAITLVSGGKVKAPVASPAIKNPSPRKPQTNRTLAKASKSSSGKRSSLSDKDTNADGQIQMHEYTDTWTDEKLEEFREKDTDGDGLLSPAEWNGSKR